MNSDWRYEPDKMALRESALSTLLKQYGTELKEDGSPLHPTWQPCPQEPKGSENMLVRFGLKQITE